MRTWAKVVWRIPVKGGHHSQGTHMLWHFRFAFSAALAQFGVGVVHELSLSGDFGIVVPPSQPSSIVECWGMAERALILVEHDL